MPQCTEPSIFYKPERSLLPDRHSCKTDKLDRAPSHALLHGMVQPLCCRYATPPCSPCGWSLLAQHRHTSLSVAWTQSDFLPGKTKILTHRVDSRALDTHGLVSGIKT